MIVLGVLPVAAALVLLAPEAAVGEWVQVPVIGRGPDGKRTTSTPLSASPATADATPEGRPTVAEAAAADPNADGVITIRRTVGDSFSNKQGVLLTLDKEKQQGSEPKRSDDEGPGDADLPDDERPSESGEGLPLRALREAHQTLLKQSKAPVSGKLDFLRRLKNRLLKHIASLVQSSAGGLFGSRADEGRGHKGVGFPSNEGTLMSLAFLVFAVFLVKVVMQLIYAVQNNQFNNNGAGVRVAQMQLPDPMLPAAMGGMMGTMMNMMPAMMPPMMAAMQPAKRRSQRDVPHPHDHLHHHDVNIDRMAANVLEAIHKAKTRISDLGLDQQTT